METRKERCAFQCVCVCAMHACTCHVGVHVYVLCLMQVCPVAVGPLDQSQLTLCVHPPPPPPPDFL